MNAILAIISSFWSSKKTVSAKAEANARNKDGSDPCLLSSVLENSMTPSMCKIELDRESAGLLRERKRHGGRIDGN